MIRWAPALLLILAGCTPAEISRCEAALKDRLKAPGTYQRVDATFYRYTRSVFITYDSENAFSALIRGRAMCEFSSSGDLQSIEIE